MLPPIRQDFRYWLPFESTMLEELRHRRDFIAPLFGGVPPWTDFGLLWDTLGPICRFLGRFVINFGPKFKDFRATNCTNHTFEQNKQGFKQVLLIINSNKAFFTFVVLQSRVSPPRVGNLNLGMLY